MPFRNELFYITPIEVNIPSIMCRGILCHKAAIGVLHLSVALNDVQERREGKKIPNGLMLHDYVNLYFNPRNPMMYLRRDKYREICVLSISPDVLSIPGAVVSDENAARDYVCFFDPMRDLDKLDFDSIYLKSWDHPEPYKKYMLKGRLCAEALIPNRVDYGYVQSAYVACTLVQEKLLESGFNKPININPDMFFRGE